jgi:hypothetical protein
VAVNDAAGDAPVHYRDGAHALNEPMARRVEYLPSERELPDPRSGSAVHEGLDGADRVERREVRAYSSAESELQRLRGTIREDDPLQRGSGAARSTS